MIASAPHPDPLRRGGTPAASVPMAVFFWVKVWTDLGMQGSVTGLPGGVSTGDLSPDAVYGSMSLFMRRIELT